MPAKGEHLVIARDNQRFLSQLDLDVPVARGWASTAAFYASIHFVEAFFGTKLKHSADHRTRDNNMAQYAETMSVYDDFSELKNISTRARYFGRHPDKLEFNVQVMPSLRAIESEMTKHCG